jgi:hypothetical protein
VAKKLSVANEIHRVERAATYILKRLSSDIIFLVQGMPEDLDDDEVTAEEGGILAICRTNRGQADKKSFILFVNAKQTKDLSANELRRTVFHEWIHAATWLLSDEIENIIKYVKESPLKQELLQRVYDARENITYELERTVGPHIFPSFDWTEK